MLVSIFGVLCEPLIDLFQLSLEKEVFPDDLKITGVTPIYNAGDSTDISNYRSIPVLPFFSKILECLIYNRLYKYFKKAIFFMTNNSDFKAHIPPTMLSCI